MTVHELNHYPRDERNRYRIVTIDPDGFGVVTLATTDSREGIGVAVCTLAEEGEFDGKRVGVLDVLGETGKKWIVHPYEKGSA